MSWHGPSGDCGCCGGDCDPRCKCVVPMCRDEYTNILSFNTDNYEWLFYFSLTGRQDVNLFFDDMVVASIVDYFQDDVLKYFIVASNLDVIEKFKAKKGSEGFCAIKELRNADYLLFDKSIMGKDSLNFKIRNLASEFLFVFLQGIMYDNTLEDFINALTVYNTSATGSNNGSMVHFQCLPICIDFDKGFYRFPAINIEKGFINEFLFDYIQCSVGDLFDDVNLEDLTGIVKTCGVDVNGNTILAKKIISSQLEIDSTLGSISYIRETEAHNFGCDFPSTIRKWTIDFEENFTGTYPGIFVDLLGFDPDNFDPYDCDNNPLIFSQSTFTPYTQFHIDSVPITASFLDTRSFLPTNGTCPIFFTYNVEYKGYAVLFGTFAVDKRGSSQLPLGDFPFFQPSIRCVLFKYTAINYTDVPFNNNSVSDWIRWYQWHAPTDINISISTGINICPEKPFNSFPSDFDINTLFKWNFNGIDFNSGHRHIGTSSGGGTQTNPVQWDAQYIAQFIDPELATRVTPVTTATLCGGYKPDYLPYYCPYTYPCLSDGGIGVNPIIGCDPSTPRDIGGTDIDNNISCFYQNTSAPSLWTADITISSNILVQSNRSSISEPAG